MNSNSININGGTVAGSNFSAGDNNQQNVHATAAEPVTPADLRDALRDAHDQLVAAAGTPQDRQFVTDKLREILATLDSGEPVEATAAPVRNRWAIVQTILGATATAGTAIAETTGRITELVTSVFGGA